MKDRPPLLERARQTASANLSALTLSRSKPLALAENITLLFFHTVGLLAVARLLGLPLLLPIGVAVLFLVALILRLPVITPTALAPFFFVYAVVALRFLCNRVVAFPIPGYFAYALPDWRIPLLDLATATSAATGYTFLIVAPHVLKSRRRAALVFSAVITLGVLGWAASVYLGQRTFGATGSDPYAYVQMGIDLAQHGNAAHQFSLFPQIAEREIPWYPLLHVGYHLPFNLQGDAITVWSPGGAIVYALAYRLGGDSMLYFVHPLFSWLSAVGAGVLAWELTRRETQTIRALVASGTAAIFATSNEIVAWAGVTMADAQATFFSVLAVYFALLARRNDSLTLSIAAGAALGIAYDVRHTQLVLVLSVAVLLLFNSRSVYRRALKLFAAGCAAFLIALPDLWYHQIYLGAWWHPESEELSIYSLDAISTAADRIYQTAFAGYEFGWLAVGLVAGVWLVVRRARVEFAALLIWLGASLAVHLPYPALRLRDLVPEFPVVAILISYGVIGVGAWLLEQRQRWTQVLLAVFVFTILDVGLLRSVITLSRIAQPPRPAYGAMSAGQRAAFDEIREIVPIAGLVGASLNSGAIDLYAQRPTFRPADWSDVELREFMSAVSDKHPTIFFLEDNSTLAPILNRLSNEFRLERVATLNVPLFGDAQVANPGALWRLELR